MRAAILAALAGLLLVPFVPAADPPAQPTKEQIETDLKLVPVVAEKNRVIEAGTQPYVEFKLVNTSKTLKHKVVKPGDGSEVGWRDPWVHVSAEQRGVDGNWTAMNRPGLGRCGLFDHDWPKDVVELKPGEELKLNEWFAPGHFEFQYPGKVRLVGHYEYRAVGGKGGKARPDAERGAIAGVPLFALKSEPVEFTVVRPLDVRVKVNKPLRVGRETKVSDAIEVTVTNNSDKPREIGSPTESAGYRLSIRPVTELCTMPALTFATIYGTKRELKPGETVTLFGGGDFTNGADGTWKGLKAGTGGLRVEYGIGDSGSVRSTVIGSGEIRVDE